MNRFVTASPPGFETRVGNLVPGLGRIVDVVEEDQRREHRRIIAGPIREPVAGRLVADIPRPGQQDSMKRDLLDLDAVRAPLSLA